MICEFCKGDFQPRKQGRPQRFHPGGDCRRAFYAEARRVGAEALRKNGEKKPKAVRGPVRVGSVERMEQEAIAVGCPGMFARPSAKPAPDLRLELGRAAQRLGLLIEDDKRPPVASHESIAEESFSVDT